MSENLKDFLVKLSEDPEFQDKFRQDPHGAMDQHGLAEEHKSLVLRRDKEGLQKEAGLDDAQTNAIIF